MNVRALAAKCVHKVVDKGRSLSDELPAILNQVDGKDKGLLQELCYGVIRHLPELEQTVRLLMKKPLSGKQRICHFLLLTGIYQIKYTRIPDHAALSETVDGAIKLKSSHLKGLINGVLRNFLRNKDILSTHENSDAIKYNHPGWFIKKVQQAYPDAWPEILVANQEKPPMWLRVHQKHHSVNEYLEKLTGAEITHSYIDEKSGAIALQSAVDVNRLPGFEQGHVSIQDGAAQQAAYLLDCQPGDKVLDCCAAPGGKTCHILEHTTDLESVTAIDVEKDRLERVKDNLARLQLSANVMVGDAADPEKWWNGEHFDRILLDAPCSGTGVIRRHPDIKWLRKSTDIPKLVELQQQILKNIWAILKPGGVLLYATCSILPEENAEQIEQFLKDTVDAELLPLNGDNNAIGWQILPNENSMDGFYYAKLHKKDNR